MNIPGLNKIPNWQRLLNSAVFWSWVYSGLRLTSGIIVLPLVMHKLSTADLSVYYVLLSAFRKRSPINPHEWSSELAVIE